jgi:DNA-directed RNA polymerase specialized sigma subunit
MPARVTARADLFAANRKLAIFLASRVHQHAQHWGSNYDELVSAALHGLYQAAKAYDLDRLPSFGSHAAPYIQRELMNALPKQARARLPKYVRSSLRLSTDQLETRRG